MSPLPPGGEDRPARFPLPALLLATLVVVGVHLPLKDTPALLFEAGLLDGSVRMEGWLPGRHLLDVELAVFDSLRAHRLWVLGLELLSLGLMAGLLSGRVRRPGVAVLLLAAYWIHPLRAETSVSLWLRPQLLGEWLAALGIALAIGARGSPRAALGAVSLATAALGAPALIGLAAPLLVGVRHRGLRWAAVGLCAGAIAPFALGLRELGVAGPWLGIAALGARDLLDPRALGWFQRPDLAAWLGWLGLAVAAAIASARGRRLAVAVGGVALGLMLAAALALRPTRADLPTLAGAITPEVFAPALAMAAVLLFLAVRPGGPRVLVAILLPLSLVPAGVERMRDFGSEARFLEAALARSPDQPRLHVLRGELALRDVESLPPQDWFPRGEEALRHADRALRQGGGEEARALRVRALAYLGKRAEAREEADRLLAVAPGEWWRTMLRGDVERIAGNRLESLRWFRAALNQEDQPLARGRYEAALEACRRRVVEARAEGEFEAMASLARALSEVVPSDALSAELAAEALLLAGDEGARDAFEDVLSRFPYSTAAMKALIGLYENAGEDERGRTMRRRLLRVAGPSAFDQVPDGAGR